MNGILGLAAFSLHQGSVAPPRDDHVIEYGDAQNAPSVYELAGHGAVFRRRSRVAGRVIVHENQRGGTLPYRGSEDLARVDERCVQDAARHENLAYHAMARVQEQRVELLLRQIVQPRAHAAKDVGRAPDPVGATLRLRRGTSSQFERCDDTCGGRAPYARHVLQLRDVERREALERPSHVTGDGVCDVDRRPA